jgi:putative FmdB family regulatory protein
MPTYEYHCDACGNHFDEFQGINEPALRKCPKCKKLKLRRIFGIGAAVIFKGSGFYQTDYRSESYKSAAKADQEASKPATSDQDDKTAKSATTSSPSSDGGGKSSKKSSKSSG